MIAESLMSEDHRIFRETVRRFVEQELLPHREQWEAEGTVPPEVWRKAGAAGLLAGDLAEEYGGFGGDFLHGVIVTDEMTRIGGGGPAFSAHSDIVIPYLVRFGTEEQKRHWLPRMASGEIIGAIAMTEPSAGSDLQAIRTTARRVDGDFVIKGQKVFISNGQQAHLVVVACKTEGGPRSKGISLLLVETDRPGFSRGRMLKKIGRKAQDTVELFFDDVRVPQANLLGEEHRGFYLLMEVLVQERLSSCVRAMSATWRALQGTIDYVKGREAFGKRIAEFQNTQFELADLWSRALVHSTFLDACIAKHLKGELSTAEAAAAKLRISELEGEVIDRCLQFFGGWGYIWDYPIARAYADARVDRISAGSNHILKMVIGRELLK